MAKKYKVDIRITETDEKTFIWSATLNDLYAGQGTADTQREATSTACDAIVELSNSLGGA